jgi:hypothetical protein
MSERQSPYAATIPMMPAVLLESHEPPAAATGDSLRALFDEMIGRVLSDHDDFEGISSGRLARDTNQGRDTWRVAKDYARRLDLLLGAATVAKIDGTPMDRRNPHG